MKLKKLALANAFGLATAILWVVCSLFVAVLPSFSLEVTRWWMHGLDVSVMGSWDLTFANFLLGGITITVSLWATGYVFGWAWEKTSEKS